VRVTGHSQRGLAVEAREPRRVGGCVSEFNFWVKSARSNADKGCFCSRRPRDNRRKTRSAQSFGTSCRFGWGAGAKPPGAKCSREFDELRRKQSKRTHRRQPSSPVVNEAGIEFGVAVGTNSLNQIKSPTPPGTLRGVFGALIGVTAPCRAGVRLVSPVTECVRT
jgi:hypothetical protein